MRLGWRWHLAELKAHYWELLDVGIYTFWGRGLEIGGMLCLFNFEMAMRFLNKLRASRRASEGVEALIRRRRRLLGKGSSLAFMRTGWCGYHHLYIFCYIKLWLLIVLYIRYILILFLLYINIDINIYVYIYIYMYMQFMIFAITLYKFLHYDLHIYIYININSYIMILYTCCDIKHACIHWTFGESNMPWARGLANSLEVDYIDDDDGLK